jgi:hypothetical protein
MTASRSCARTACGDDVWALHYRDLLQKSLLFLVSCQWHIAYAPAGLGTSSAMTTWHRGCAEVTNCHRGPVHLPAIPTTCRAPKVVRGLLLDCCDRSIGGRNDGYRQTRQSSRNPQQHLSTDYDPLYAGVVRGSSALGNDRQLFRHQSWLYDAPEYHSRSAIPDHDYLRVDSKPERRSGLCRPSGVRWRPEMQRRTIVPKCLCLVLRG